MIASNPWINTDTNRIPVLRERGGYLQFVENNEVPPVPVRPVSKYTATACPLVVTYAFAIEHVAVGIAATE